MGASRSLWQRAADVAKQFAIGGSANDINVWKKQEALGKAAALPDSFFDLTASNAKGEEVALSKYRGQVTLVCNVASR